MTTTSVRPTAGDKTARSPLTWACMDGNEAAASVAHRLSDV